MQKWTLRLYPECVFPECTNPDHVDFPPNAPILNDRLILPLPKGVSRIVHNLEDAKYSHSWLGRWNSGNRHIGKHVVQG